MKEFEIIFESENIYYVNITEKLIDDYLEMINNPEVSKFISLKPRFFTFEDENNWIKQKQINNSIIFSMKEKNTNEFIGNIEILEINNNIGEIGLCIIPKKQGKHYGLESIKRFIKYCVNILTRRDSHSTVIIIGIIVARTVLKTDTLSNMYVVKPIISKLIKDL